tara:strand:- start:1616 stop:2575 length:960 start_codon:yes stop_codon:yes gene_type:complete
MITSKTNIVDFIKDKITNPSSFEEIISTSKKTQTKRRFRKYLEKDILNDFHNPKTALTLHEVVEKALNDHLNGKSIPKKGLYIDCYTMHTFSENKKHTNTIIHASVEVDPSALQHSCVRHFIQIGDTNMRFQIPFIFLTKNKNKPKGNFWVYHIRFGLHESKNGPSSLEQLQKPFGSGYIGVTSRHPFVRLNEHYKKFRSGEGNLIHQQWRSLDDNNISHLMIFQITGRCETEEEMYDGEEKLVEVYSLTPKGFNMIPGGKNGIRFLEKHGFKNVNIENKEDFASTFLNIKKKTHYRKPHIREYKKDHFTFISGTWVNV